MSAVNSVTNANAVIPIPPVKAGTVSGGGAPLPVDQPVDTADISRAGARGYLQLGRIAHGVKSGQLTGSQAKTLAAETEALHDQIATAKAANGGKLSIPQALNAAHDLNQISQQIYGASHTTSPGLVGPPTPAPSPAPAPGSIVNVAG